MPSHTTPKYRHSSCHPVLVFAIAQDRNFSLPLFIVLAAHLGNILNKEKTLGLFNCNEV